ncbi:MAG: isoprenylcysteine carboxylmethyltransferase family protein [Bdellovibrionales bacterium]|nr:isoprenylcysteine carboxylmethyltransferase family protein [Bdellovibrionales bacterium]
MRKDELVFDGPIGNTEQTGWNEAGKYRIGREMLARLRPGDLLLFYHRTSWRSRLIRLVTGSRLPHTCVYVGRGRVLGMLRGVVRYHRLSRFFRNGYEIEAYRARPSVLAAAERFRGMREHFPDLLRLAWRILLGRLLRFDVRQRIPVSMRGVTCSGIVGSALTTAYRIERARAPMSDTPYEVERAAVGLGLERVARLRFRNPPSWLALGFRYRVWWYFVPYGIPLLAAHYAHEAATAQGAASVLIFSAGWVVAIVGQTLRAWGAGYVGPVARGMNPGRVELATGGPYRFVRHPLYLGNILGMTGFSLSAAAFLPPVIALLLVGATFLSAWGITRWILGSEEPYLLRTHGAAFARWASRTPALLPQRPLSARRITRAGQGPRSRGRFSAREALRNEAHVLGFRAALYGLLLYSVA